VYVRVCSWLIWVNGVCIDLRLNNNRLLILSKGLQI
jgi:hypothetical protein